MKILIKPRVQRRRYDESVFCETCLSVGEEPRVAAAIARRLSGCDPQDVVMDFVTFMLKSGRWQDYRPAAGTLKQFVVNWLMRFTKWQTSNRHRNRWAMLSLDADAGTQHRTETSGEGDHVRLRSNVTGCREAMSFALRTSDDAVLERKVYNAVAAMTGHEDDVEALRLFIRTGSTAAVAAGLGVDRTAARLALRRARKAAAKFCRFV